MIRRLFYLALGAYAGAWATRRLQALKPDHLARRAADRAVGLAAGARQFADEARRLSAGRESELRARYGLDDFEVIHHHDVKDGR
ncbi:hypothetical protein [Sphaerisporangium sp. TRM90804]|uniref:hypothetical protein n=1 Tax=Sphaerisporangium sp. TRM90804 TaxID=3031113 RepID=UPI00244C1CD7|nr:hypothetical protein [Sphaerisporangium sp. TRM90804]MDH2427404.1 hypothetical protein [Sphaerisporangium sp. TRM90804]